MEELSAHPEMEPEHTFLTGFGVDLLHGINGAEFGGREWGSGVAARIRIELTL
jgi:hypothetical protein